MSGANVWFVAIDESGEISRATTNPPSSETTRLPRVTTIHVVNWHGEKHNVTLSFDLAPNEGESVDIVIDVPKM